MLFKKMMRLDNDDRSSCFEPDPPLDAYDGIAYMNISPHAIGLGNGLQVLDGFYRVAEFLPIDLLQFTFFEYQLQVTGLCLRYRRRPRLFRPGSLSKSAFPCHLPQCPTDLY